MNTEYKHMLIFCVQINGLIVEMNNAQILDMIDKLRKIEKKMSLVYTFFKASMFTNNYGKLQQQQETNRPAL